MKQLTTILFIYVLVAPAASRAQKIDTSLQNFAQVSLGEPHSFGPEIDREPKINIAPFSKPEPPLQVLQFDIGGYAERSEYSYPTDRLRPSVKMTVKRGRGNTAEIRLPDQGIITRMVLDNGSEIFRPGQHVMAGALTAGDSWRREVDLSFSPPILEALGVTLSAGAFSDRRPMLNGYGTRHGVGELTRWRESNVFDLGLKIDVPGTGIRYEGGLSRSEYSLASGFKVDDREILLSPKPQWRKGFSQWHKIEADLLDSNLGSASAYATYGTMDTDYRSYQHYSASPLIFEGSTVELGGKLERGKSAFAFSHRSTRGDEIELNSTTGRLKMGRVDLSYDTGTWTFKDKEHGEWSTTDRYWKSRARISLKGKNSTGILPDWIAFNAGQTRREFLNFNTQSSSVQTKQGFSLGWSRKGSETDISISHIETIRHETSTLGASLGHRLVLDFNQSYFGDWWDFSIYGSVSTDRLPEDSSKFISGGLSFSIDSNDLPKISVGLDVNRLDLRSPGYEMRDQEVSLNATLDLSKHLPDRISGEKTYLVLKAFGDWSLSGDTYIPKKYRVEPSLLLAFGMKF